ncbi:MAG: Gfo/Idh/MocA family protein [Chloroflexota bacterium]
MEERQVTDRRPRYGVIGAKSAGIGWEHLQNLLRLPGVEVAALCNTNAVELEKTAQAIPRPVATYTDAAAMYEAAALDAVVIATPNFTHEVLALQAFDAGVHVLCEKPLAPTLAGCDAIIAAGERAGRLLQVGQHRRYNRLYLRLQQLIEAGELGRPVMMWAQEFRGDWAADRFADHPERGRVNWRFSQDLSGGTLLEKNAHDFDVFNWFAGAEPVRVMASGGLAAYEGRDTLDHAMVIVEYANGFKADLQLSLFVPHGFHGRYAGLVGDRGSVKLLEGTQELFQYFRDRRDEVRYVVQEARAGHGHGMYGQHEAFAACIREGRRPAADGEAGRAAVLVALAAEKAIRTGQVVDVRAWAAPSPAGAGGGVA